MNQLSHGVRRKVEKPGTRALAVKLCSVFLNLEPDRQLPRYIRKTLFEGGDASASPMERTTLLLEEIAPRIGVLVAQVFFQMGITSGQHMRAPALAIENIMRRTNWKGERVQWRTALLKTFDTVTGQQDGGMTTLNNQPLEGGFTVHDDGVLPPTTAVGEAMPIPDTGVPNNQDMATPTPEGESEAVPHSPPHINYTGLELPSFDLVTGAEDITLGGFSPLFTDDGNESFGLGNIFEASEEERSAALTLREMFGPSSSEDNTTGAAATTASSAPVREGDTEAATSGRSKDYRRGDHPHPNLWAASVMELTAGDRQQQPGAAPDEGTSAQHEAQQRAAPPTGTGGSEPPTRVQGGQGGSAAVQAPCAGVLNHPEMQRHQPGIHESMRRSKASLGTIVKKFENGRQCSGDIALSHLINFEGDVQALHTAALTMNTGRGAGTGDRTGEQAVRAGHIQALATILLGHVRLIKVSLQHHPATVIAEGLRELTRQLNTIEEWTARGLGTMTRRQDQQQADSAALPRPILRRQIACDLTGAAGVLNNETTTSGSLPLMVIGPTGDLQLPGFSTDSDGPGAGSSAAAAAAAAEPAYFQFTSSESDMGGVNWYGGSGSNKRRRKK